VESQYPAPTTSDWEASRRSLPNFIALLTLPLMLKLL
jgi:hypothetical protein